MRFFAKLSPSAEIKKIRQFYALGRWLILARNRQSRKNGGNGTGSNVKAGDHKPYVFDGRPFHRVQSTSPIMPQHRYEQLIVERGQQNHSLMLRTL